MDEGMMCPESVSFMARYFSFSTVFDRMSRFLKLKTTTAPFLAAGNIFKVKF
jgi:hypothetical protein